MGTTFVVSTIANFRCCGAVGSSASSSLRNRSDGCTSINSSAGRVDVGRRGFLRGSIALGVGIYGGGAVAEEMAAPEVGLQDGRLRGCDGRPPCVSTSAFQSPSRFMPPWTYLGTQEDAYVALKRALARMGAQVVNEDGRRYVYALQSSTKSKEDIDDLEFLFKGKVVCYRSVSRVFIPDPHSVGGQAALMGQGTEDDWRGCETTWAGCRSKLMKINTGSRYSCIDFIVSECMTLMDSTLWSTLPKEMVRSGLN